MTIFSGMEWDSKTFWGMRWIFTLFGETGVDLCDSPDSNAVCLGKMNESYEVHPDLHEYNPDLHEYNPDFHFISVISTIVTLF
jgi:hypothetical protein